MGSNGDGWLEVARRIWDERAADWDRQSEENAVASDRQADLRRTADALRLRPGAVLLDAGCGSGQFALAYAKMGCRVTAVDLSPAMIALARRHAAEQNVDVDWRVGDLAQIAGPSATYDAIHARVSLQFVPDVMAALVEFRRVLKPGGRLFVSVPGTLSPIYNASWRRFVEPDAVTVNFIVPWELEQLLTHLGWSLVDGWGEYGASATGEPNRFVAEQVAAFDRRLQQASATIWVTIAE